MKYFSAGLKCFSAILSLALVGPGLAGYGQQGVAKPVLSANPVAAPATPAAPVAVAAGPQDPLTYIIGADDALQVTVWKEPNLSSGLIVRPDGKISLPLVGDVMAAGLTPMQLSDDLKTRLKKYITDPTVSVVVAAVNSKRVFMVGEVAHIGPVPITPGMTVLQAIATAGGLTPFANQKHIYILRGAQGKQQQKIPFDYKKAVKSGDLQGVTLSPGDTIVVP